MDAVGSGGGGSSGTGDCVGVGQHGSQDGGSASVEARGEGKGERSLRDLPTAARFATCFLARLGRGLRAWPGMRGVARVPGAAPRARERRPRARTGPGPLEGPAAARFSAGRMSVGVPAQIGAVLGCGTHLWEPETRPSPRRSLGSC